MLSSCHIIFCFVHTTSSAPLVPVVMNADYTIPYYLFAFALATDSTSALYAVPRENLEDDIRGKKGYVLYSCILYFYMFCPSICCLLNFLLRLLLPFYIYSLPTAVFSNSLVGK